MLHPRVDLLLLPAVALVAALPLCNASDPQIELMKYLKNNITDYHPMVRPRLNHTEVVNISVAVMVNQIVSVDSASQSFKISALLLATWEEQRLVWDPSEFGGVSVVDWGTSQIWFPIIFVYNGIGDNQLMKPQIPTFQTSVSPNSTVVSASWKRSWEFSCEFDMRQFPFDQHTCDLELYMYDMGRGNELVMPHKGNMLAQGYMLNVVTPLLLLTLLQVLVFFVPVESGEKLGFGITIMLSYTVFLLLLDGLLPKSQSMPAVASFITAAMVLSTSSLLLTSVSIRFHFAAESQPMPSCLQFVFVSCLGRAMLCGERRGGSRTAPEGDADNVSKASGDDGERPVETSGDPRRSEWQVAAVAVERLMAVVGCVATVAIFCVFLVRPFVD